jgi:hypothetical protein
MSLELKYIMILSSSTLEKSDFLYVFVSKARWDCPTLVSLRTLMSTRLGTLTQNAVNAFQTRSQRVPNTTPYLSGNRGGPGRTCVSAAMQSMYCTITVEWNRNMSPPYSRSEDSLGLQAGLSIYPGHHSKIAIGRIRCHAVELCVYKFTP